MGDWEWEDGPLTWVDVSAAAMHYRDILERSTRRERIDGRRWYGRTRRQLQELAESNDADVRVAAGVAARLSPMVAWEAALEETAVVLHMACTGEHWDDHQDVPWRSLGQNRTRALKLARACWHSPGRVDSFFDYRTAPKITSFFRNIAYMCDTSVTIDMWMVRAAFGVGIRPHRRRNVSLRAYEGLADAVRAARPNDMVPHQAQSVIWITTKRLSVGRLPLE